MATSPPQPGPLLAIGDGFAEEASQQHDSQPLDSPPLVEGALSVQSTPASPLIATGASASLASAAPKSKSMGDVVAAIQAEMGKKRPSVEAQDDEVEDPTSEVLRPSAPKGKSRGRGKGAGRGRGRGRGKAASKPKAKAKAKAIAASTMKGGRPAMPPLRKVDPIHYGSCVIYCDAKGEAWRAIAASNSRRDVRFPWRDGKASWSRCLAWCEEHSDF